MLLPKRIWRDIPGYEGLYQVSNTGQVRSLNYKRTGQTKILKPAAASNGYKTIRLCKNGKCETYTVHRLVAQAFIPNPNNLPCVNHKDENKTNNVAWNLEWCSYSYNNIYGTKIERHRKAMKGRTPWNKGKEGKKGKDNPCATPILMFNKEGEFIKRFDCIVDACEYLGKKITVSSNIIACAKGRIPTAYKFKWKYEEDCK